MADDPGGESAPDIDSLSFEQAFQQLAELAESLDAGGLTLAEATSRYEQGMVLVRRCNQLLDATELKITSLKEAYSQGPGGQDMQDLDSEETNDTPPNELLF